MTSQRKLGQYYTTSNPFDHTAFVSWLNEIDDLESKVILEPFAGANNIPMLLSELGHKLNWSSFDIEPSKELNYDVKVIKRDTIKNFPKGYKVAITNPPYLAKNSATRRGIAFPETNYDDLYKLSLHKMLENVDYVAAIIPETFLGSGLFTDRLTDVIILDVKMFETTDAPVCLALFKPKESSNKSISIHSYKDGFLGSLDDLKKHIPKYSIEDRLKFNDPKGSLGLYCIDLSDPSTMKFVKGETFDEEKIKPSSRSYTRISGIPDTIDIDVLIEKLNLELKKYRKQTHDVFLASFKGLRKDGKYRRRMDFKTARKIINKTIENLEA